MGYSRIKEFISRKTVRCIFIRRNGTMYTKTLNYGRYGETIFKDKAYWVDPEQIIRDGRHSYIFYDEDNPYPLPISLAVAQGYFKSEIKSGTFSEALRTKFLDEVTRAPGQVMLVLVLALVNCLISIIIIAKLWGAFDK